MSMLNSKILGFLLISCVGAISGCAGIYQFPDDPAAESAMLKGYEIYFSSDWVLQYETAPGNGKEAIRNTIVVNRMLAYDGTYEQFRKRLLTDGNTINTGSDLINLALSGLGATTGVAATKSALAAGSAGVLGAKAAISADLFYQRTLPALITQMDANRATVKADILSGLNKGDSDYPLWRALVDLERLNDAGSMISAVGSITEDASKQQTQAEARIAYTRDATYKTTLNLRKSISDMIGQLSDTQLLQLMQRMNPLLATDTQSQPILTNLDSKNARLTSPKIAQLVMRVCVVEGGTSPDTLPIWLTNITSVQATK